MQNGNNGHNARSKPEVGQIIKASNGFIATVPAYNGRGYMTVLLKKPEGWEAVSDQKLLEARTVKGLTCFLPDKPGAQDIRLTRVGENSASAVVARNTNNKKGKRNRNHSKR